MMGYWGASMTMLFMLGAAVLYVLFFVAVWRLMRAHESLAESLRAIAAHLKGRQ